MKINNSHDSKQLYDINELSLFVFIVFQKRPLKQTFNIEQSVHVGDMHTMKMLDYAPKRCVLTITDWQVRSKAGQHSWDIISLLLSIRTSIISKVHRHSTWKKLDTQGDWPFCKNFGLAHTSEWNTTLNYTQWHALVTGYLEGALH